ncbi:hypothetical protein ACP70R_005380 [Stipagrostis hirtigluma subsp. patula]
MLASAAAAKAIADAPCSTALRVAKDITENNCGARVLVACAVLSLVFFRSPAADDEASVETLLFQALFGDGPGAVIVGADPDTTTATERPLFEMVATATSVIPSSERAIAMKLGAGGLDYRLSKEMPALVADKIERCLVEACRPVGGLDGDWNKLFWVVHPGGPAILDGFEAALKLEHGKLWASRRVLSDYGMACPSSLFLMKYGAAAASQTKTTAMVRRRRILAKNAASLGPWCRSDPGSPSRRCCCSP